MAAWAERVIPLVAPGLARVLTHSHGGRGDVLCRKRIQRVPFFLKSVGLTGEKAADEYPA